MYGYIQIFHLQKKKTRNTASKNTYNKDENSLWVY